MKIGYGKLGRSMPLTLDGCGNLGGDVECVAVVKEMALRHPDDTFYLLGRNTGERPVDVGLPANVINPWSDPRFDWALKLRLAITRDIRSKRAVYTPANTSLSVEEHLILAEIFKELTQATFVDMDAHVWWVGQHGSTNMPVPMIDHPEKLTKPYDWCAYYASYVFQGINAWRDVDPFTREEVYLNADARNKHKMRDLKWPLVNPILTQFTFNHQLKHERYGDPSLINEFTKFYSVTSLGRRNQLHTDTKDPASELWQSECQNVYSRLEINGLAPGTPFGELISYDEKWDRPGDFGLFINEARAIGITEDKKRVNVMKDWVLPLNPYFIHGTWSKESMDELDIDVHPTPWDDYYPKLHSVRTTFTTPSSGSGWATAKPWEAFAGGTVCFFHPAYDTQDNILRDAHPQLKKWLRVDTPQQLRDRVNHLNDEEGRGAWLWIVREQRKHFDTAMAEKWYLKIIDDRIWG